MDGMRWLALALALVPACNLKFNSQPCGTADNQWICAEGLACADPPTYCGTPPPPDQCAQLADFTPCSLATGDGVCLSGVCGPCAAETAGCKTHGAWEVMASGTTQTLRSLWVASETDVYVVGDMATLLHYDGHMWTALDSSVFGVATSLLSIWGADDDHLFVVGGKNAYRLVAGVWTRELTQQSNFLNAVWGSAVNDVRAVGANGVIYQFDGTQWNPEPSGTIATLNAIWGTDANHIWAVGNPIGAGSTVLSFNSGVWGPVGVQAQDPNQALNAIGGSGPADVYAVGDPSSGVVTVIQQQPGSWLPLDEADVQDEALLAVWARGPGDFLIGGHDGLLIEGQGTTWTTHTTNTSAEIDAVMGSSADNIFAVGAGGLILHYTTD